MKVLQINVVGTHGSTGRIASELQQYVLEMGVKSEIAFGRGISTNAGIKIGNRVDQFFHLLETRLFDNHAFASRAATEQFLKAVLLFSPDIIHLHNLHGYYLNIELLFRFLQDYGKPVVWTLHDCWAFTGHCTYFTHVECEKWKSECNSCPLKSRYPASFLLDGSQRNFKRKKELISNVPNVTLVTVSDWLRSFLSNSFLKDKRSLTIYNGINLNVFSPSSPKPAAKELKRPYVLGVANIWAVRKGLKDFFELRKILPPTIDIVLMGLTKTQIASLPAGIIGMERVSDIKHLASFYAHAEVFVNPSVLETFGMVTAEALACGTPVVVYDATASPELVQPGTGYVVAKHNIAQLADAIQKIIKNGKAAYTQNCREVAVSRFNKETQYEKYLQLYRSLLAN